MRNDIEKILISEEEVSRRVRELGEQLTEEYKGKKLLAVSVLKGGFVFAADLVRCIDLPLSVEFMIISSYGNGSSSTGHVEVKRGITQNLEDTHVLIVEDIVDSGNSLAFLKEYFQNKRAKSVKICAMLDKPERRETEVDIDYLGFTVPNEFIVGYGLDFAEKYRNLPYIGVLKREIYE